MTGSDDGVDARPIWAINGRYTTQRMTGVQRYAHEIVASLDKILAEDGDIAKRLGFRLILPGEVQVKPALSQIDVCQTKLGSGHAWDQFVLPWYARSGVLSLGNLGPIAARNHIVCIHDANTFIEPKSYSRHFGLPATLAMTTWLRSTRRRYVWHSRPRRRDLEFRRWRR